MTKGLLRIALPKLFLWSEPTRFQEYPAAIARAEDGRVYSRLEVERELFDILPTLEYKGGIPRGRRTDGIVNTYGLERSGARYRINGINLLHREGGKLTPTTEGLELGKLYRDAPDGPEWPIALARQLLLREPRTRLLIGLMLQGSQLEVTVSGVSPTGQLALIHPDGSRAVISQRNCSWFNELLFLNAEMALGPYWRRDLEKLDVHGFICWEGVQGKQPSTNDLPTALKKALALFFHIELLSGVGGLWELDGKHLRDLLGDEVADSFGIERTEASVFMTDDEAFAKALADTIDSDGFVIVSRLADQFGEFLNIPPQDRAAVLDSFVRNAMYHERLRLLEHHPGQPRMGRGLFGDNDSRRVRLDFNPGIDHDLKQSAPGAPGAVTDKDAGGKQ